ncbi:hypothetical protein, partial [Cronobacter sakazakii]|uniref:hypothetical protein n=1 Tax=Cronobacter sakazakii TaxID=28141 RepID=UPI001F4625A4
VSVCKAITQPRPVGKLANGQISKLTKAGIGNCRQPSSANPSCHFSFRASPFFKKFEPLC